MKISQVNYHDPSAGQDIVDSLKNTGFCILTNPPVDDWLIEQNYKNWNEWFQQPLNQKKAFSIPNGKVGGYACRREIAINSAYQDHKEIFDAYQNTKIPPELKTITEQLTCALKFIGMQCTQWIQTELPNQLTKQWPCPLPNLVDENCRNALRIAYYPPLINHEKGAQRAAPHADINMLTIQPAPTTEGLQACDTDGIWHDIPLGPNQFIIKIGDMLAEFTNQFFTATDHRVINPVPIRASIPRIATPFFLHFKVKTQLSNRFSSDYLLEKRLKDIHLLDAHGRI